VPAQALRAFAKRGASIEVLLTDLGFDPGEAAGEHAPASVVLPCAGGTWPTLCGATHKAVKRVVQTQLAGCRAAVPGAAAPQLTTRSRPVAATASRRDIGETRRPWGGVAASGWLIMVRTMSGRPSEHRTAILERGEGRVQASCSCGWRSAIFGADKRLGAMDALQQAADAVDLHEWDASLP